MRWSDLIGEEVEREMIGWRRHLHAHPELSFEEFETTSFLTAKLQSWGIETERAFETGVIARVGRCRGPVLAIRADIDALPIAEESGASYASVNPGKMHACGHDGHMAILLGVAKALSGVADDISGEVRLVFQPAEEVIPGGAKALVESGRLADVDKIIGLHLWSGFETGTVVARSGPLMASTDMFTIKVMGAGGHGATPHETVDPIFIASTLVCSLQSIVSRNVDPREPCVVTVASFNAGSAFNVIPATAEIRGTVRSFSKRVRHQAERRIREISEGTAAAFGARIEVAYTFGNPPVVNDDAVSAILAEAAGRVVPSEGLLQAPALMVGEDFAYYGEAIPSAFALVGAGNPALGANFPHHHPRFDIDERALGIGARLFMESVGVWSALVGSGA